MCYVGKATKIFFLVVGVLAASGLLVGFGLLRHGRARRASGCVAGGCRPVYVPDPIPVATPSAGSTTTNPAAAPPPLPLAPPGPPSGAFGPAHD